MSQVLAALQANLEFAECRRRDGDKAARATSLGQAISYRFKLDEKGWRVFVTTKMAPVPAVTDRRLRRDWSGPECRPPGGNGDGLFRQLPSSSWRVPLVTYGRSSHQAEALIGDSVANVVEHARSGGQARRD